MRWKRSRFRAGAVVEVRSPEEILVTLDERGRVDGLPFMPEMVQFCGRRFTVRAVAHKTCETARQTHQGRWLDAAVHLADLRCDGSAHGGCQALCTLFWKDVWLKATNDSTAIIAADQAGVTPAVCDEAKLLATTLSHAEAGGGGPVYSCQATCLYDATRPLAWWDMRQYLLDVTTGNHSVGRVLRVTFLASVRWILGRVRRGYRIRMALSDWVHRCLTGRDSPSLTGKIKAGNKTPTGRLDLRPGELVRIKSKSQIEESLDEGGKNRGLSFDPEEMAPYCGRVCRVRSSVTRILDEATGEMRSMKQPCIILEGVVCNAEYARCRLNCPRAIPAYWREIWLERVEIVEQGHSISATAGAAATTASLTA